jgi:hypothetical protein
MATTISVKRIVPGIATFESFEHIYFLTYKPSPTERGKYFYDLTRAGQDGVLLTFATLSEARRWVTENGYHTLDALDPMGLDDETETEPEQIPEQV